MLSSVSIFIQKTSDQIQISKMSHTFCILSSHHKERSTIQCLPTLLKNKKLVCLANKSPNHERSHVTFLSTQTKETEFPVVTLYGSISMC